MSWNTSIGSQVQEIARSSIYVARRLTSRQREVFEFIRDKITGRGYGPTVREIGDNFRISSPTA